VLGPQFYIFLFSPEQRNRDRFCGREPRCRTGGGPYSEHPRDRRSILVGVDESWANVCCFRRIRDWASSTFMVQTGVSDRAAVWDDQARWMYRRHSTSPNPPVDRNLRWSGVRSPENAWWRACRATGRNNRRGHMNGRFAGVPTNSRSSGIPRTLARSVLRSWSGHDESKCVTLSASMPRIGGLCVRRPVTVGAEPWLTDHIAPRTWGAAKLSARYDVTARKLRTEDGLEVFGLLATKRSLNLRGCDRRYWCGAWTWAPNSAAACQGHRGS